MLRAITERVLWRRLPTPSLFSILILAALPLLAEKTPLTLHGIVADSNGAPLADVRVVVAETSPHPPTFTSADGGFSIGVSGPGFYTFRLITKKGIIEQRHEVSFDQQELRLILSSSSTKPGSQSISVTATSGSAGAGIVVTGHEDRTRLSRYTLSRDEIERVAGAYGDSLKAVTTLPGVFPAAPVGVLPNVNLLSQAFLGGSDIGALTPPYANSVRGPLVIRGAGARASRFTIDGFRIQYPFHLGDQASVIHNDFIRSVDLYSGTPPLHIGQATGGYIALSGPDPDREEREGSLHLALFLTDAYLQAPFADNRAGIAAAARKSYPNYTMLRLWPDGIPANAKYANYEDGQFKLTLQPTATQRIEMLAIASRDRLQYTQEVDNQTGKSGSGGGGGLLTGSGGLDNTNQSDGRPPVGLERSFHTGGVRHRWQLTERVENRLQFQISRFEELFELDFHSPFTGETIFGFSVQDHRQEVELQNELSIELWRDHLYLRTGVAREQLRWELSMKNLTPSQSVNPGTPDFVDTIHKLIEENRTFRNLYDGDRTRFRLDSAWAELELLYSSWRLSSGWRGTEYSLSGDYGSGPRFAAEYTFTSSGTTLLAAGGRYFSPPPLPDQISSEAGNPWLQMEQADQVAFGLQQPIGNEWQLRLEFFRNHYQQLVVEDRWIFRPLSPRLNRRDLVEKSDELRAEPLESRPLFYSNDGTGESRGAEVMLRKISRPGEPGWYGWLSYTYSISMRNNHQTRLSDDEREELIVRDRFRKPELYFEHNRIALIRYDDGKWEAYGDNDQSELYDYDRTHMINLVAGWRINQRWQIGARWNYASATPYSAIDRHADLPQIAPQFGRMTFLPQRKSMRNQSRLTPRHQLDIRIDRFMNYHWGYANAYLELINLYARQNPEQESFNFLYPYIRHFNPDLSYESSYAETPIGKGRQLRIPLINAGLKIRF